MDSSKWDTKSLEVFWPQTAPPSSRTLISQHTLPVELHTVKTTSQAWPQIIMHPRTKTAQQFSSFFLLCVWWWELELGFELRGSHLQNRLPLTWAKPPFCSGYFGDGISHTICLSWPPTSILPISAYQAAKIIGMSHPYPTTTIFLITRVLIKIIRTWHPRHRTLWWEQGWCRH
jgi:hypothetical protein